MTTWDNIVGQWEGRELEEEKRLILQEAAFEAKHWPDGSNFVHCDDEACKCNLKASCEECNDLGGHVAFDGVISGACHSCGRVAGR